MSIKNGRMFRSKIAAYTILHPASKRPTRYNSIGDPTEYSTDLTVEFAIRGDESTVHNPLTGAADKFADIRGHFLDTAQYATERGWTQAEHDAVVDHILRQCEKTPDMVWEVTPAQAPRPWPTYDDAPAGKIATLAGSLGLAAEALAYERQNKNRKQVVEDLEALLATAEPAVEETADEIVAA